MLAGEDEGPALILAALLLALGERAAVEHRAGVSYVRVELRAEDVARLPPHACLISRQGRFYVPLDARRARTPFAFLPRLAQRVLLRR